jgi:hypothetical protein
LDSEQVITDLDGIDFADRDTVIAEAIKGARDFVASGIKQNEDVSGQSFIIRDEHGQTVARALARGPGTISEEATQTCSLAGDVTVGPEGWSQDQPETTLDGSFRLTLSCTRTSVRRG